MEENQYTIVIFTQSPVDPTIVLKAVVFLKHLKKPTDRIYRYCLRLKISRSECVCIRPLVSG